MIFFFYELQPLNIMPGFTFPSIANKRLRVRQKMAEIENDIRFKICPFFISEANSVCLFDMTVSSLIYMLLGALVSFLTT